MSVSSRSCSACLCATTAAAMITATCACTRASPHVPDVQVHACVHAALQDSQEKSERQHTAEQAVQGILSHPQYRPEAPWQHQEPGQSATGMHIEVHLLDSFNGHSMEGASAAERPHHYSTGDECGHEDDRQLRQAAAAASGPPCLAGSASSRHPAPAWQTSRCKFSADAGRQACAPTHTSTDALASSGKPQM